MRRGRDEEPGPPWTSGAKRSSSPRPSWRSSSRSASSRSAFVRAIVWASFLAIVLVPAAAVGYLFSITKPVEWLLGLGFLTIAILWDYYRLNPEKVPWLRSRT